MTGFGFHFAVDECRHLGEGLVEATGHLRGVDPRPRRDPRTPRGGRSIAAERRDPSRSCETMSVTIERRSLLFAPLAMASSAWTIGTPARTYTDSWVENVTMNFGLTFFFLTSADQIRRGART